MNMMEPLVTKGDRIWLKKEDSNECVIAIITKVKRKRTPIQYKVQLEDSGQKIKTLLNSNWGKIDNNNDNYDDNVKKKVKRDKRNKKEKIEKKDKSSKDNYISNKSIILHKENIKYILAPMVGASELAFRLLCRKYGATLAYTPMINSEKFVLDKKYRQEEFQSISDDRPLVAHFSANDPQILLKAAQLVENSCDAIDLNLGCPQRVAFQGHFGSFLLDEIDRPLILNIVKTVKNAISIPIFVKIRLLSTIDETIRLVEQLRDAGASLIAIHARHRVNLTQRTGPSARDGPALLDQVKVIKEHVKNTIPIISNGNVRCYDDLTKNLEYTKADGIMSAEGILDDPGIFSKKHSLIAINKDLNDDQRRINLAKEYLSLTKLYPTSLKTQIFHIRRMCKEQLIKFQLMEKCLKADSRNIIIDIINKIESYLKDPEKFIFNKEIEEHEKSALDRKKWEEGKRKRFEDRMRRKAKREGLKDIEYYISQGIDPPSIQEITYIKNLDENAGLIHWKTLKKYKQHCFWYHYGKCPRDRSCGFLHSDPKIDNEMDAFG